ncbi:MAG: phospho-sugar mutase [Lachnospirales bacterium]
MDFMSKYNNWLEMDCIDDDTKNELKSLADNKKEIEERFYKELAFGTGGIRGIIGAGDNRMNIYTVGKATQGLSNYILNNSKGGAERGVAIAYDSRRMSPEFAKAAALILAGNGIKVYLFESLRPTPMLSFAVRYLNCISGIVITASHNPPEYNGYKVYWEDGAQIAYPVDENVIEEVNMVSGYDAIIKTSEPDALSSGMLKYIGKEVDEEFYKNVLEQVMDSSLVKDVGQDLKIVYTPIHGTGNIPVREVLSRAGFKNVSVVKEQELPDENFTTVGYPNPEDPKVFELAIKLANKEDADIIVGTDPDADRVGAVVKNNNGEYVVLSGNMTGTLITEYILSTKKNQGVLKENDAIISTVVSTDLTGEIAKSYGVSYFETLTGFKYIGEKIKLFKKDNSHNFLFGFEESYGCLAGTYARDKDAVVATLLLCEASAYYKKKGKTLYDALIDMYNKYGYYSDGIKSITLQGKEGSEKIVQIINSLRSNPLKEINGVKTVEFRDYSTGTILNLLNSEIKKSELPSSNVLYFVLEDKSWFCVRPSGTEPKIKIYCGVIGESMKDGDEKLREFKESIFKEIEKI